VAPREVLDGPAGAAIRNAAEDRAAILGIIASLSKVDRRMLPDVEPAVNALVERIAHLARMLHRMDASVDAPALDELDARIAEMEREGFPSKASDASLSSSGSARHWSNWPRIEPRSLSSSTTPC
jgi:hypothetical protein